MVKICEKNWPRCREGIRMGQTQGLERRVRKLCDGSAGPELLTA